MDGVDGANADWRRWAKEEKGGDRSRPEEETSKNGRLGLSVVLVPVLQLGRIRRAEERETKAEKKKPNEGKKK